MLPIRFDRIDQFSENRLFRVELDHQYGLFNEKGALVIPLRFDELYENSNVESDVLALVRQGEAWFWLDRKGKETVPSWCNVGNICELRVEHFGNGRYGYIHQGLVVIPPRFDEAFEFGNNSLAKINIEGKKGVNDARRKGGWGYINIEGTMVIQPRYDDIGDFLDNGLVRIVFNGKYGYANDKGKEIIPPRFDEVDDFDSNDLVKVSLNGKYGYVNRWGDTVTPLRFDAIYGFAESGMAIVKLDGKYGYINAQGQEVIPPQFDEVEGFDAKGVARVAVEGKWRRINRQGETVAGE
ncbi:hypothetical protein AGMMS49545_18950 [Betaproteobacteria bacterium]|nr:hypothetical protein AGMMS49545_18950 [Betaproteobacteria bacterium]GHU47310.1 hypothetical protein AGMMS50289_22300 [Betaproteobacteria bacterium]